MSLAYALVLVAAAAALAYLIARALAARELADARAGFAGELAAARQDNQWLRHELERQQASLGATQSSSTKPS